MSKEDNLRSYSLKQSKKRGGVNSNKTGRELDSQQER